MPRQYRRAARAGGRGPAGRLKPAGGSADAQGKDAGRSGTALLLETLVDDAQRLSAEEFELRHGGAFLLLTAASLSAPAGPCTTELKLLEDEESRTHTANLSVLVYPIRRSAHSLVHLVTVGRATNNDVVVRDVSVSRFHAFLKRADGGEFLIQDAGSTNGTSVNGRPVPARGNGPPQALRPGDDVRLGQVDLTFVDARGLREFAQKAAGPGRAGRRPGG
jgi:hypothetical protein